MTFLARRTRLVFTIGLLGLMVLVLCGHVGTNDVTFAGEAGPYRLRVSIRLPGAIPGLADINVRVADTDAERVLVTALRRINNRGVAPPPDIAAPVRGVTGLHTAQLWLMTRGPHTVIVTVEGGRGSGTLEIPVTAAATRQLAMTRGLQLGLAAGGLFLIVGLLTIVGVAARESVLEPGDEPGARERKRARIAVASTAVVTGVLLFGGWTWIGAEAARFGRRIDQPWPTVATLTNAAGTLRLDLAISDSTWLMRNDPAWLRRNASPRRAELIADHGKLMHMFIVREPELDALAHLHPETVDGNTFSVTLPPLAGGRYRIYADLAHEDGSQRTLVTRVDLPAARESLPPSAEPVPARDPDDAWWNAAGAETDGEPTLRWSNEREPMLAGTDVELVFEALAADGSPIVLEPYMGMLGHVMLNRADGEVFIHAHPAGMITMAAAALVASQGADSGDALSRIHHAASTDKVHFPIVTPSAGRYRIWVQVRVDGRVLTRAFDTEIR